MQTKTNEQALESSIEKRLTGKCLEELKEEILKRALEKGKELFRVGTVVISVLPIHFNAKYAIL